MDPRSLYTLNPGPWAAVQGRNPVLIHLLEGYVDAGGVTRGLSEHLLATCEHEVLVEFDVDQLHDYRARRPMMTFDTNQWLDAVMPRLTLHKVLDAVGVPFLLLSGPEPDSQWARACDAILGIAEQIGVSQLVSGGGVPMGVPHTRPLPVTSHATQPEMANENPVWVDRVSIPGSFSTLLEIRAGERELLGRGFVAHVPHYLAQGSFAPATARILGLIREAAGLDLPSEALDEVARTTLVALNTEVAADPELATMVEGLEGQYDELAKKGTDLPTVDEIGVAVERFFAEQDDSPGEG